MRKIYTVFQSNVMLGIQQNNAVLFTRVSLATYYIAQLLGKMVFKLDKKKGKTAVESKYKCES